MRDFLEFIMPSFGYVEIRSIRNGMVKQWWEEDRQAAIDLAIAQSSQGFDAYYGVLPRLDRHGDGSVIADSTDVLWADLDAKMLGSKQQALMKLVQADIPPSVVIDSGHGYHAYWKLGGELEWLTACAVMKGIAKDLNGDHVYDKARIMRIPGTMNWKDADHPVPVRTIVFDTTNIRPLRDFHEWYKQGAWVERAPVPTPRPRFSTGSIGASRPVPGYIEVLIRDGVPQGQRSEAAFKVMCELLRCGWTDANIHDAFASGGIGEKMREMRDGERWFNRSLERAKERLT